MLVVDDTVTDRKILSGVLSEIRGVDLVGTAPNGQIGLSKIELKKPDLVLLDLFMPEMDGLQTLAQIKKKFPDVDVVIISGVNREDAKITVKALEAGALDFIPKPRTASMSESMAELKRNISRLIPISQTRKYSRQIRDISKAPPPPKRIPPPNRETFRPVAVRPALKPVPIKKRIAETKKFKKSDRIDIVALGVSTGGPNALQTIVPKLDHDFPVPILAVQHMPPMFTASLAQRLDTESSIKVVEGGENQNVEKGVMYIAPGGKHMVVRKSVANRFEIGIVDSPPVNSCKPAVDVLFRSISMAYGGRVLMVILTGMGNDGASGVAAIRRKGGYAIVQDEKTSVVWGMPGTVAEAGQADEILPLDKMAERIMGIVKEKHG